MLKRKEAIHMVFKASHQTDQLNQIFQAETNIDTPFQCIWGNIYGIGDFKKTTAPAIQIKCHPSHKIAIQTLLLPQLSLSY